jgi:hypothetical protein
MTLEPCTGGRSMVRVRARARTLGGDSARALDSARWEKASLREARGDDTFPGGPPPSGDLDSTSYGDNVFVHKSGHKLQTIYLYL